MESAQVPLDQVVGELQRIIGNREAEHALEVAALRARVNILERITQLMTQGMSHEEATSVVGGTPKVDAPVSSDPQVTQKEKKR